MQGNVNVVYCTALGVFQCTTDPIQDIKMLGQSLLLTYSGIVKWRREPQTYFQYVQRARLSEYLLGSSIMYKDLFLMLRLKITLNFKIIPSSA